MKVMLYFCSLCINSLDRFLRISYQFPVLVVWSDSYSFIKADKSNGAHNPSYTRYLLNDTIYKLDYALLVVNQLQRVAMQEKGQKKGMVPLSFLSDFFDLELCLIISIF
ncbi:MAG: hypothetical protein ACMUIU_03410 [bacterium]